MKAYCCSLKEIIRQGHFKPVNKKYSFFCSFLSPFHFTDLRQALHELLRVQG